MENIPISAIAMATGLLGAIWAFLAHMILSQAPTSHLQFFLDLMGELEEVPKDSSPRGSSPCLPDDKGMNTSPVMARSVADKTERYFTPQVLAEAPLLFATSLRGRGL